MVKFGCARAVQGRRRFLRACLRLDDDGRALVDVVVRLLGLLIGTRPSRGVNRATTDVEFVKGKLLKPLQRRPGGNADVEIAVKPRRQGEDDAKAHEK